MVPILRPYPTGFGEFEATEAFAPRRWSAGSVTNACGVGVPGATLEEITVTGSRIRKADVETAQPIVVLDTGVVHGFEALIRWPHQQRGLIPPGEFLTIAEDSGLIVP